MNKEIFISYTSTDRALATTILKLLEQNGFACWMAPRDIPPGEDYSSAIPSAIIASTVVVALCSPAAYESPNVKAELRLAFDYRKQIIPFKIDTSSLPNSWLYFLAFSQWIDAADDPESHFDELLASICRYVRTGDSPDPQPDPKHQPATTYNVGDYYDDGLKQGVVFEVDASGRHGKLVSLSQSGERLSWCLWGFDYAVSPGATNPKNGSLNQRKIEQTANWPTNYPAFAWCADLGNGWYLPAIEELKQLMLNRAVYNAVNQTLLMRGGMPLLRRGQMYGYWSSTQNSSCALLAYVVYMGDGAMSDENICHNFHVRAVAQF